MLLERTAPARPPIVAAVDVTVVGAGLVGLATANALVRRFPGATVVVLEKEPGVGAHQSGRNSGVVHTGLYYAPGSRKAELARRGAARLREYCRERGIPTRTPGKLVVATRPEEAPALAELLRRGRANGVDVRRCPAAEAVRLEPHVRAHDALFVAEAGVVDYRLVCRAYAEDARAAGVELLVGTPVIGLARVRVGLRVETQHGAFVTRTLVNCAGLHADRVARMAGLEPPVRIVPFRGEFYSVRPERRGLVRGLVYPVPNPAFPFLGVHLTRSVDGGLHAGPNAVLALRREGYARTSFGLRDAADVLGYPGFWRLAARNAGEGARELGRSLSRAAFARSARRLVPELEARDLVRAPTGVRAQAVARDGSLVDDFLILDSPRAVHVLNAPSPGATASLAIGEAIAARVELEPSVEGRARNRPIDGTPTIAAPGQSRPR